jgi:TRAP-type C4-dicarboxylate transport system permease small subunit
VIGRASKGAALVSGLATLVLAVIISFDVLMRYFLNRPQLIVDEVGPYLLLVVIFGAAAQTFRLGGHVRVDLVTAHLGSGTVRAWLRVVTLLIGVVFLAVVIWAVMLYPLWVPMLLIPAGLLLMVLCMVETLRRQLRSALGPRAGRDEVPPSPEGG